MLDNLPGPDQVCLLFHNASLNGWMLETGVLQLQPHKSKRNAAETWKTLFFHTPLDR
ncbi:elongation factor P [Acetobacter orientalis]|uniref:Elongation factor P n=1 Tax=Acetobacter orientalis TaxID=146474 RepID=A0A2Z5ZFP5_9PROT|nr:elongation factor P [Acetobacter orientalis]